MVDSINNSNYLRQPQRSLQHVRAELFDAQNRFKTGKRIVRTKNDTSGFCIAAGLAARIAAIKEGIRNLEETRSALLIALDALEQVEDLENKIAALNIRKDTELKLDLQVRLIDEEINKLTEARDKILNDTCYNGKKLLDGTLNEARVSYGEGVLKLQLGNAADVALMQQAKEEDDEVLRAKDALEGELDDLLQGKINARINDIKTAIKDNIVAVVGNDAQIQVTLKGLAVGEADEEHTINIVVGTRQNIIDVAQNWADANAVKTITDTIKSGQHDWNYLYVPIVNQLMLDDNVTREIDTALDARYGNINTGAGQIYGITGFIWQDNGEIGAEDGDPIWSKGVLTYEIMRGGISRAIISVLKDGAKANLIKADAQDVILAVAQNANAGVADFAAPAVAAPGADAPARTTAERIYALCKEKYDAVGAVPNDDTLIAAYNASKTAGAFIPNESRRTVPATGAEKGSIAAAIQKVEMTEGFLEELLDRLLEAKSTIEDVDALESELDCFAAKARFNVGVKAFLVSIRFQQRQVRNMKKVIRLLMTK